MELEKDVRAAESARTTKKQEVEDLRERNDEKEREVTELKFKI